MFGAIVVEKPSTPTVTPPFDFVLFNGCGNITASDRTTFALAARLSATANMGIGQQRKREYTSYVCR